MDVPGGTPSSWAVSTSGAVTGLSPGRDPALCNALFPAECCKGNGQDVGQGRRLPLEAPTSPSSPPKSSNDKSNVSSRSGSSPSLAPAPLISQGTRGAPSPAMALPHAQSTWQEGDHDPVTHRHPPALLCHPHPFDISSALTFFPAEKAEPGKRWQQNTSWATSPKCPGAVRKCRYGCFPPPATIQPPLIASPPNLPAPRRPAPPLPPADGGTRSSPGPRAEDGQSPGDTKALGQSPAPRQGCCSGAQACGPPCLSPFPSTVPST